MADLFKCEIHNQVGIGGMGCSCCDDGAGKKPSRRKKRNRKAMKKIARTRVKRATKREIKEETE